MRTSFLALNFPANRPAIFFRKTPHFKSNRKRTLTTPFFMWRVCYVLAILYRTTTKAGEYGVVNWFDNINWPPLRVSQLTFQALILCPHSHWQRANTQNFSFETLSSGQFTSSTQFIIPNYPVILSHQPSTTVSLETNPLYHC